MQTIKQTPLDGVTATTTSSAINMEHATKASFEFIREDHSSGSSKFEILASLDGTNFTTTGVMMVKDVANTNSQNLLRALSTTLSSDTSEIWHLPNFTSYIAIKIKTTETTDGTATCRACITYN